jgi:hypothetical protein
MAQSNLYKRDWDCIYNLHFKLESEREANPLSLFQVSWVSSYISHFPSHLPFLRVQFTPSNISHYRISIFLFRFTILHCSYFSHRRWKSLSNISNKSEGFWTEAGQIEPKSSAEYKECKRLLLRCLWRLLSCGTRRRVTCYMSRTLWRNLMPPSSG